VKADGMIKGRDIDAGWGHEIGEAMCFGYET
jgi:hypothetical protein